MTCIKVYKIKFMNNFGTMGGEFTWNFKYSKSIPKHFIYSGLFLKIFFAFVSATKKSTK